MAPDYVSIPEAARMLGISPKTMGQIIADSPGMFDLIRPRVQLRVRRRDVIAYRNRAREVPGELPPPAYENVLAD